MDSFLEELKEELDAAVDGMTSAELTWHPAEKWCAAEVLEHLFLTYTGTAKSFEKVLAAGKPMASRATLKNYFQTFAVLQFNYLPEGRKAPSQTLPRGLPAEKVRDEIGSKIAAMAAIIANCERQFGRGKLLDHPILGPLSAAQWRKFHLLHGRHHMKQILRLREGCRIGVSPT